MLPGHSPNQQIQPPTPHSIKSSTADATKAQKDTSCQLKRYQQEVYLGIKEVREEKIIEACDTYWLENIKDDVIDFTHKMEKYMLDYIRINASH